MKRFGELLNYLYTNREGKFIFYDRDNNRFEYDSLNIKKHILIVSDHLKSKRFESKKDQWIRLISKDNCSTFFMVFALLSLGYNVLLANPNDDSDRDSFRTVDSDVYYEASLDKEHDLGDLEEREFGSWVGFYSSGTTGYQKKFVYNVEIVLRLISNVRSIIMDNKIYGILEENKRPSDRRILSTLPMYHILGFLVPFIMYSLECDIVFCKYLYPNSIIDSINKDNILGVFGVPLVWELIMNMAQKRFPDSANPIRGMLGDKIQIVLGGGSKTNRRVRETYVDSGIDFFVGYGMTEIGFLSLSSSDLEDIDSEGSIYPMYDYKILNEQGKLMDCGEGELVVDTRGIYSYMFDGGEPKSLDLIEGKYFETGDIFILEDGKLYFRGRKKNIIVSSNGENIFADEIETRLDRSYFNNIPFCIGDYQGLVALYLYNYGGLFSEASVEAIIRHLVDVNKGLHINSKIKKSILINEKEVLTSKGGLAIYKLNENSNIRVVNVK